jgi:hypothetical protein
MALFDRLCGALECLLLDEEQTFVSADCCSTAGLFTAAADRSDGGVTSNTQCQELRPDRVDELSLGSDACEHQWRFGTRNGVFYRY